MMKNELIREAIGYMERSAYTKEELDKYQQWKIDAMTATAMIDNARIEGETIGIAKGKAEGLQEGEAIGLEKEKEKAVIRGHNKGHSIDTIAEFTELSTEQIIKILKENGLKFEI